MGKASELMAGSAIRKISGGSVPSVPLQGSDAGRPAPAAGYFRDTRSGVFATRPVSLRNARDDVRRAWPRSAALAIDLMQNSGRLRGAADQVITDTVGTGLSLNFQPRFSGTGMSEGEQKQFIEDVKTWWRDWSRNPRECDQRGKFTIAQLIDISLRWNMAFGEVTGLVEFMPRAHQRRYNIESGTKLCLVPPSQLVQETNIHTGLFQGVWHDENGRPNGYRFKDLSKGYETVKDYPAYMRSGMPYVLHIFDADDATSVRGISVMAAAFRKHIQHEQLDDATLQAAILQTVFAATLTSEMPTEEALAGIEALKDAGDHQRGTQLQSEYIDYLTYSMKAAAENAVQFGSDPQINHLAPGETFNIETAKTPGAQYLPFSTNLARDMARALGVTFGGFTMNHENATYSSTRMESATIWPIATRRRERIASPICQSAFDAGLDEQIRLGRIAFGPGYRFFAAHRAALCRAQWRGPAKPSADDYKSARAASERLENGTSSIDIECSEMGQDPDEVRADRLRDHQWYIDHNMASPYARDTSQRPDLKDDDQPKGGAQQ